MKKILGFLIAVGILLIPQLALGAVTLSISGQTVPSTLAPGESGTLQITVSNSGTTDATNVELLISSSSYITFGKQTYQLQTIGAGTSKSVSVPITISSTAPAGSTTVKASLDYREAGGAGEKRQEGSLVINIVGKILLRIKNVTFSEAVIDPGEIVDMKVDIENLGDSRAKDVTIELDLTDLPFVPIESDVVQYLSDIQPRKSKSIDFKFIVNRDATSEAHSLPVTFDYKDDLGNSYEKTTYIGVPISGEPNFIVSVETVTLKQVGYEVVISIANRGSGPAQFLSANFPDYVSPQEVYVGEIESDDFDTITVSVEPGVSTIPMTVSYRDNYNQEFSFERNVEFTPPMVGVDYGSIIILLVIAGGVYYWWKKKKKKKK
jgi:hypothetical protein